MVIQNANLFEIYSFFFILNIFYLSCNSQKKYHPKISEPNSNLQSLTQTPDYLLPKPQINLKTKTVEIIVSPQKKIVLKTQIAETPRQRAKGLMYRKYLPESEGMLFIFKYPELLGFYMANCYISLDMIFMDSQKKIIGFLKNQKPMDSTVRDIGKPSQYVLEVNGGFVDRHNIKIGTKMYWED